MRRFFSGVVVMLVVALGGLVGCNGSSDVAVSRVGLDGNKGFMVKTIHRGMWTRKYGLFVPMSYTAGTTQKFPVIIFLHGIGEGAGLGEGNSKNMTVGLGPAVARKAESFPFIVIFPQSGGSWAPDSEYAEDVIAELDQVSKEYPVDQDCVILTGLSTGGAGAWAIGAKYHDRFSAIVPMASNGSNPGRDAASLANTPVRAYCSVAGDLFAGWNDQSMVNKIKQVNPGANAQFIATSTFGHDCWEDVYRGDELFNWMRQQRRGGAGGGMAQQPTSVPKVAVVESVKPVGGTGVVVKSSGSDVKPAVGQGTRAAAPVKAPVAGGASSAGTAAPRVSAPLITPPEVRPVPPASAGASPKGDGGWVNTSW